MLKLKTLHLALIAFLLSVGLFSFNATFAQNETQPTIEFNHPNYFTEKMSCEYYVTGNISPQDPSTKKAIITVTDSSANKFSTAIDRVAVSVWSDSDKRGIEITAYETAVNSGIFQGTVTISEGPSTQDIIHVSDGDTLSAGYSGGTPWSPGMTNGTMATAFIGMLCPPLERVPASGIKITDNEGNEQKVMLTNKQIQISSNLTNVAIRNQTFAYVVQIQDKSGVTKSFSWLSGMLLPSQTLTPSVSWTPTEAGKYTVQAFVWQSINNPNALSPPVSAELTIWPSFPVYAGNATRDFENSHCQSSYVLVTRSNNNSIACVTSDTAQILVERGWARKSLSQTSENTAENKTSQLDEFNGVIVDQSLDARHFYSLYTNDTSENLNIGSNGISLEGLNDIDGLDGKCVKIFGTLVHMLHSEDEIKVDKFHILDSLVPKANPTNNINQQITLEELYSDPDKYYNQTVTITGQLREYDNPIAYAGVGCNYAQFTTNESFVPDFVSRHQLYDGQNYIGVRIGGADDVGYSPTERLSSDLKNKSVSVTGIFVPEIHDTGMCMHVLHKSGYILTDFSKIASIGG